MRQLRRGFGRFVMTTTGVALGVAVLFAVQVANTSASRSFEKQFFAFARPAVSVYSPTQEVPDSVFKDASTLAGVHVANAYVGFEARFHGRERDGEPWHTWIGSSESARGPAYRPEREIGNEFEHEGTAPRPGRPEVSIGDGLARELSVGVGDDVELDTPTGTVELEVTTLLHRKDGRPVDNGIYTSPETARRLRGSDEYTYAYIELADGTDVDEWLTRNRPAFPRDITLANATPDTQQFREFTEAMNGAFAAAALLAVFIGSFLIFLTLSMQVTERTALYAMFRALGASRPQVARTVLAEAFALGVVATAIGLLLGLGAAVALTRLVADLYGIESARIVVTTAPLVIASVVGVAVTVAGAVIPAVRAARLDPVAAMRPGVQAAQPRYRLVAFGAIVLCAATAVGLVRPPTRNDPTLLFILAGAVLVLPVLVGPLARVVGAATRRLARGVGAVGVLHLRKETSRSAYTMGLVMVVLATVLTLGTARHTFEIELARIVDLHLGADVFGHAGSGFDDDALDDLRVADGLRALTTFRALPTRIVDGPAILRATIIVIDPDTYFDVLGFAWSEGSDDDARSALSDIRDPAVIIGRIDGEKLGLGAGDTVRLDAPNGPQPFRIVGVTATLDSSRHEVFMGAPAADSVFGAAPASWVRALAEDGVDAPALQASMRRAIGDRSDVSFRLGSQERADAARFNERFFSIFAVVVLVALVVGLLGLANTLALAVFRRTRELGVLRAVGTDRRQLAGMVLVESLTLAIAAAVLAVPLGALTAALVVKAVSAEIGTTLDFAFDWAMVPVVAITAAVLGGIAAWLPARRASRVQPVVALRFD